MWAATTTSTLVFERRQLSSFFAGNSHQQETIGFICWYCGLQSFEITQLGLRAVNLQFTILEWLRNCEHMAATRHRECGLVPSMLVSYSQKVAWTGITVQCNMCFEYFWMFFFVWLLLAATLFRLEYLDVGACLAQWLDEQMLYCQLTQLLDQGVRLLVYHRLSLESATKAAETRRVFLCYAELFIQKCGRGRVLLFSRSNGTKWKNWLDFDETWTFSGS